MEVAAIKVTSDSFHYLFEPRALFFAPLLIPNFISHLLLIWDLWWISSLHKQLKDVPTEATEENVKCKTLLLDLRDSYERDARLLSNTISNNRNPTLPKMVYHLVLGGIILKYIVDHYPNVNPLEMLLAFLIFRYLVRYLLQNRFAPYRWLRETSSASGGPEATSNAGFNVGILLLLLLRDLSKIVGR